MRKDNRDAGELRPMAITPDYVRHVPASVMIEQGARFITETMTVWQDCGVPSAHLATNRWLLENGCDNSLHNQATLDNSQLVPPVYLADHASIENSLIGPHAVVGPGCRIVNSRLRDTIVMADSSVLDSQLDHSLVGERVIVRNYRGSLNIGDDCEVGQE